MHKPVPLLMCRMCHQAEETIVHLLSACVSTAYLHRHNLVAMVVHWHLMKVYSFPTVSQSWCSHRPPPVFESSVAKILWDFSLHTVHNHSCNCPDIVLFDYQRKQIYFIEVSCPADINVLLKEEEKSLKYRDLASDFQQMYGMPGIVSSRYLNYLKKIPEFSLRLFAHFQKAVIIGTSHTLRMINLN